MPFRSAALKAKAIELGFNLAGITRAEPSPTLAAYFKWIAAGMHGSMTYMARDDRQARRRDLDIIVPGARSMVIVGLDYRVSVVSDDVLRDPSRGRIASYAWGLDYHDIMTPRLKILAEWMQSEHGLEIAYRHYVDTGAILERSHAQQAGIGFIGKNTMLIHPRRGSYFFLGEFITDIEFDTYDEPHRETMCGTCTRCIAACPTAAFPQPYVLDARRCISYLTIEHKGWIDRGLRPLMGNWIFGCDICQDVCPFQRFAMDTHEDAFIPGSLNRAAPKLIDILQIDDATFDTQFTGSPVYRIKRERLVRNACIAAGNSGDEALAPALRHLLSDANPLIRGHAVWALSRLLGKDAHPILTAHDQNETDAQVHDEIEAALTL
ncbi:MAG: tRNA epoxyqueuosine(34) reductase QueG [Phototrophicales bacterium]|nr:MAG: tRNA epoxyqueuosine(34) reductase QueG [Phototrophicales bacterium]